MRDVKRARGDLSDIEAGNDLLRELKEIHRRSPGALELDSYESAVDEDLTPEAERSETI